MKYVILEVNLDDKLTQAMPIIFPQQLIHVDIFNAIAHSFMMSHELPCRVRSAGFINALGECYGYADTLGRGSLPGDANIIRNYDHTNGMLDK